MSEHKTTFKIFTIYQSAQEEEYLNKMHEKGWKFMGVNFPGFYHFTSCEPGNWSYRMDYNHEGLKNEDEYVRMFADCGWEHICNAFGYSYFRKEGNVSSEREEIFCDEESKYDMMKRVFKGRLIPLILIFMLAIIPQLFTHTIGNTKPYQGSDILSFVLLGVAILYMTIFLYTAIHFYRYERIAMHDSSKVRMKYIGIFSLLAVMVAAIIAVYWLSYRSVYKVKERTDGFMVEAEQLNKAVTKEYELKKGDTVIFNPDYESGRFHFDLSHKDGDSVFYCDSYSNQEYSYEIKEDGYYVIEVSGRKAKGDINVTVRENYDVDESLAK